ncbi:basic blue protein-like [Prosopis cineraria]|uniref:basic blue protein-like n=1 Tax=Prosopis cineraria TaxID=364024 RepID=UPI00240FD365|nr:basic blue protein-like [Prosopis cineraria]
MMWEGRGGAARTLAPGMLLLCLLLQLHAANAATYTVGGSGGWSFNSDTWAKGKRFRAGDVLVFNYDATMHNVVALNRNGYKSCSAPAGARVLSSGKDQIRLAHGQNYFICGNPGHCQSGMRLAINAA